MNPGNIPPQLRERKQWVLWKYVIRDGEPTKVPFQPNGREAKANDGNTWHTFDECYRVLQRGGYEGLGFEFATDGGIVGIDLDGCRNPETGETAPWARYIVLSLGSYAEVSPTKTGLKVLGIGKSPFATGRKCDVSEPPMTEIKKPGIEIYDKTRYFAITGLRLANMHELRDVQQPLGELCKKYFPVRHAPRSTSWQSEAEVMERARKYVATMPPAIAGDRGHDKTFRVACVLVLGFELSLGAAYQVLAEYSERCEPPWSEKDLRHKIEQANKQPGERGYLRDTQQEDWHSIELPHYESPAPRTAARKSAVRITTLHEATKAYVDKLESGGGELISLGLGEVDRSIGGGVEKGEIIIMAARPSHGKSCVGLQTIHEWTSRGHKCLMISEEMSAIALGKRSLQFASDIPMEYWFKSGEKLRSEIEMHFANRAPCWIAEGCKSIHVAAEEIRKAHREREVTCVVVDYLQLLADGKTRYEGVTQASVVIRQVVAETNITLVALAQLSREVENRPSFTPKMSDIRESGQIEQDADVILFLCWPWRLDSKKPVNEYQFFVAKNRNRETLRPAITCRFEPSRQMILPERLREEAKRQSNYEPSLGQFSGDDF